MDRLFAPWRIEWVERDEPDEDPDGCVFCALQEREDQRAARVVAESDRAFVLLNNYPYNPGHAMVIPRRHTGDYRELDDEALLDHARLKQRALDAMAAAFDPDGFNAGLNLGSAERSSADSASGQRPRADASGGSIGDHLHTHVVPRWQGDTNFMPVISESKVIVEAVADSYDRLREAFAGQDGIEERGPEKAIRIG